MILHPSLNKAAFALLSVLFLFYSCDNPADDHTSTAKQKSPTVEVPGSFHPAWSDDATIYEVNIRQHTPEGTFKAFEADIPRIKEMGIEILWLMPIHPIGELNRKGGKGSYYSVQDYKAVNPEFGDLNDFQDLVKTAHSNGMKVIIDWVANHSAWDNVWIDAHPEYYALDSLGKMYPPVPDWSDVVKLDYDNDGMREAMIDALRYWVNETDIDGYRCDVAMMVPTDFWEEARRELDKIKPVFMLAEAEVPEHHNSAFDMSYSWELMHIMNEIAKGEMDLSHIDTYMAKEDTNFHKDAIRMTFTTNHDENSWNGTVFERYGDAHTMYAVLAYTIQGMPLLYSGQEAGMNKRLAFFEKDTVPWNDYALQDFYTRLLKLNRQNKALHNGIAGGSFKRMNTGDKEKVYAYYRTKGDDEVVVILNFSDQDKEIEFKEAITGEYKSIFNDQVLSTFTAGNIKLGPFGYQVYSKTGS